VFRVVVAPKPSMGAAGALPGPRAGRGRLPARCFRCVSDTRAARELSGTRAHRARCAGF